MKGVVHRLGHLLRVKSPDTSFRRRTPEGVSVMVVSSDLKLDVRDKIGGEDGVEPDSGPRLAKICKWSQLNPRYTVRSMSFHSTHSFSGPVVPPRSPVFWKNIDSQKGLFIFRIQVVQSLKKGEELKCCLYRQSLL